MAPASVNHAGNAADFLSGWRYRAVVWSVLLAGGGYLGFALCSGWQDVISGVGKIGFPGVGVALSLSLLNYCLRFIRWQAYLSAMGHPVRWRASLKIYFAGFALTTTPGKAGEALRGVLLKRWGIPYPTSFAALLSERLSDLLAIVLLALFGLAVYPQAQPWIVVGVAAVLLATAVLSSHRLLQRFHRAIGATERFPALLRHLLQILLQARRCHAPLLVAAATALSVMAWMAEAWAFHLVLQWVGLHVALAFAVFVYAASMLAGAVSFMPGGLGGAEAVMVGLLLWAGAGSADAIAATLIIRMATLWFAVAIGVLVLLHLSRQTTATHSDAAPASEYRGIGATGEP